MHIYILYARYTGREPAGYEDRGIYGRKMDDLQ